MVPIEMLLATTDIDRAAAARRNVEPALRAMVQKAGLSYPPKQLFFRALKEEKELEIWGASSAKGRLKWIKTYPIEAASGVAGPKFARGDRQVPEGWYHVDRFNPKSNFHLSLGLDYPNKADLIRTKAPIPAATSSFTGIA